MCIRCVNYCENYFFGDFSFGIIFQQVTQRLVTHCAGDFGVEGCENGGQVGLWW